MGVNQFSLYFNRILFNVIPFSAKKFKSTINIIQFIHYLIEITFHYNLLKVIHLIHTFTQRLQNLNNP